MIGCVSRRPVMVLLLTVGTRKRVRRPPVSRTLTVSSGEGALGVGVAVQVGDTILHMSNPPRAGPSAITTHEEPCADPPTGEGT